MIYSFGGKRFKTLAESKKFQRDRRRMIDLALFSIALFFVVNCDSFGFTAFPLSTAQFFRTGTQAKSKYTNENRFELHQFAAVSQTGEALLLD